MSERYVKLPSGLLYPRSLGTQVPENFKVHHKGVGQTFANDCARYCLIRMSDEREYKLSEPTKEAKEWLAERDHAKRKLIEERPGFDGLAVPAGTPRVWQAFAATDTNRPIVQFNASWQVPRFTAIPTDHGQTLTYWNGISPSLGGSPLLQPVMQWGPSGTSGAGTVSGFGVACWYVVDNGWFVSPLVSVSPSDSLVGSITKHGKPPSDLAARILSGHDRLVCCNGGQWLRRRHELACVGDQQLGFLPCGHRAGELGPHNLRGQPASAGDHYQSVHSGCSRMRQRQLAVLQFRDSLLLLRDQQLAE